METLADSHHLILRKGTWYYRRRVPKHAVEAIGTKVIQLSLGTASIKEARKSRNVLDVKYDALFEAEPGSASSEMSDELAFKEHQPKIPRKEIISRINDYFRASLSRFEESYLGDPALNVDELREIVIDKSQQAEMLGDHENPFTQSSIDNVFKAVFPDATFEGLREGAVAELVRRGLVTLARNKVGFITNDRGLSNSGGDTERQPEATFGEVASDYLKSEIEKSKLNGRKPKWFEKVEAHVGFLVDFVGKDVPISKVDFDVATKLQSALARMPANRSKLYPNMGIWKAIELAEQQGKPVQKPLTQSRYLDFFRAVLDLAVAKRLISNNPAFRMRPLVEDKIAAGNKRKSFSEQQIAALFNSNFYRQWPLEGKSSYHAEDRNWRFWMPILAAYTGMRPGEICQLEVGDIKKSSSGIWYFHVEPTEDDDEKPGSKAKSIKTEYSRRSFPLHPVLETVGFHDFLIRQKAICGNNRLFPELKRRTNGYYSDYPCRRFREAFLPAAITVEPRQTFYSLRHSFRDALRRIDAPNDVLSALGGWTEGTKVSDNYGDKHDPDYLYRYVSKVSYAGVKLEFRYS